MIWKKLKEKQDKQVSKNNLSDERGAALAIAIIVVAILSVVGLTALAFSSSEARIAGSDLQRTQTFYASSAGLEKMTNDFSNLFRRKMNPTTADLNTISGAPPDALLTEGFTFTQNLAEDTDKLNELRAIQGLPSNIYPRVNIPDGAYAGLYASIIPYKMSSTASREATRTEVKLEREYNNYLVPLFQFGMFSNEDIEIHPGPLMTFNGRIHSNKNIYALRNTKFLNRLTMAGEFVRDATRGGESNTQSGNTEVYVEVNGINVQSTLGNGSVKAGSGTVGGPNLVSGGGGGILGSIIRGLFPGSPNGIANPNWETESVKPAASSVSNRFGGQIMTQTTGASALKLPLELAGNNPAEIIKRALPSDDEILSTSRYHNKSKIRILIDDESAGSGTTNVAGIPAGKGVMLSTFIPSILNGGENVLKQISNSGTITGSAVLQKKTDNSTFNASTVRAIKNVTDPNASPYVPPGSGVQGRILIEIVKPDGTTVDVTQTILSMGVTEGEPNGIVYLQRPLWAAYVQGSRDRRGNSFTLSNLTRNYQSIADGEINDPTALLYANRGFINTTESAANEDGAGAITRQATPSGTYNSIVPINVYNVREGWVRSTLSEYDIYRRGVTSVVELNMRNLARWVDGVYDNNLLAGTTAVSTNINGEEGYVVYVSDRRGDRVNPEYQKDGTSYASTNGIVDNEDIYGPNGSLDAGEDVIDFGWNVGGTSKKGTLQKNILELPDLDAVGSVPLSSAPVSGRTTRANSVLSTYNANSYFRRAVRVFDGETLSTTAAAGKLSPTKGITVSSENMVYIWGNFNTTGVSSIPTGGSTLNDGGFLGAQVPSSIVCDAIFPLSKTWFDASSALYPEGSGNARGLGGEAYRMADEGASTTEGTTVRAAIIAGTTVSALTQTPGRDAAGLRRNGGIINYPRFQETWNLNGTTNTWSYAGSFVPLYRSTQALANWENDTSIIYMPPRRNWSFDSTFLTPNKLPPGTPFFQYVQSTGFRQSLR